MSGGASGGQQPVGPLGRWRGGGEMAGDGWALGRCEAGQQGQLGRGAGEARRGLVLGPLHLVSARPWRKESPSAHERARVLWRAGLGMASASPTRFPGCESRAKELRGCCRGPASRRLPRHRHDPAQHRRTCREAVSRALSIGPARPCPWDGMDSMAPLAHVSQLCSCTHGQRLRHVVAWCNDVAPRVPALRRLGRREARRA